MCAKHTVVSVFPHIERKFMSFFGGVMVLYIAGRNPSFCIPSLLSPWAGYQYNRISTRENECQDGGTTDSIAPLEISIGGSIPHDAETVDVEEHVSGFHVELFFLCVAVR